jgi:hypothetical protein
MGNHGQLQYSSTCHNELPPASAAQEIAFNLKAAEQVLGLSGSKKVSLIQFHSSGYINTCGKTLHCQGCKDRPAEMMEPQSNSTIQSNADDLGP